jgi:hypothetical protein
MAVSPRTSGKASRRTGCRSSTMGAGLALGRAYRPRCRWLTNPHHPSSSSTSCTRQAEMWLPTWSTSPRSWVAAWSLRSRPWGPGSLPSNSPRPTATTPGRPRPGGTPHPGLPGGRPGRRPGRTGGPRLAAAADPGDPSRAVLLVSQPGRPPNRALSADPTRGGLPLRGAPRLLNGEACPPTRTGLREGQGHRHPGRMNTETTSGRPAPSVRQQPSAGNRPSIWQIDQ